MNYISTRKSDELVSFKAAVVNGLAQNGGLYVPESIPKLPSQFFDDIQSMTDHEIAFTAMHPFVKDSLTDHELREIISETLSFPTPVVQVHGQIYALELFHGPTQAFKDIGARFMSRCLSRFNAQEKDDVVILVATSGDTGSAVANGFYNIAGVQVFILFPKGKVSPYQEYQMTSLGKNIDVLEVEGDFDDCQRLVKQAFNDDELRTKMNLSSANSINIARLLPQMLYYFLAFKQLKGMNNNKITVAVPSGNLGNLTAGLIAQKMGLPIKHFIAGLNANDTLLHYLQTGIYEAKASVETYSNAMDVGDPSNFERIDHLYNGHENICRHISAQRFDNNDVLAEIKQCYEQYNYLLDPHGAIGKLALHSLEESEIGLFLVTASPQKFSSVIKRVIPDYQSIEVDLTHCRKVHVSDDYKEFKELLLKEKTTQD